jgi:ABC-2 type transport system permease protein
VKSSRVKAKLRFNDIVKKYLQLLNLSWQNGLVYRTSVILWRFRQMLSTVMALTVWSVLFQGKNSLFAYSADQMISYIFLVSVLQSVILATALNGLAGDVYGGRISHLLLKPVNLFGYLAASDLADKLKNFAFVIFETIFIALIFKPVLIQPSLLQVILFILASLLGVYIYFLINLLFGALGFWSPESWGPRFLFFMIIDFTAGKFYPLDILPSIVQKIVLLTPFPYFSYVQIQIILGRIEGTQLLVQFAVILAWCVALTWIVKNVWKKGLRDYAAAGQ